MTNETDKYGGEVKGSQEKKLLMRADESREKSIGGGRPPINGLLSRELAYATRPTFLFAPSRSLRIVDPTVINSIKSLNRDAPIEHSHRTCSRIRAPTRFAIPGGNCAHITFISARTLKMRDNRTKRFRKSAYLSESYPKQKMSARLLLKSSLG